MLRRRSTGSRPAATRSAASAALSEYLPEPGKVVSVGFEDVSLSWRTRVEHVEAGSLVLVAPTRALGEAIVPDVGRPVIVGWAETDGYFEAECSFEASGVDTVVTWVLEAQRIARLQRRSAFRIELSGPVTVALDDEAVEGRIHNLSEGGLGCSLPRTAVPDEGAAVRVTAELEDLGSFESEGRLVRVSPGSEPGQVEVGIAFEGLDEARAEDLRQFVFAEQLRRRRAESGR